MAKIKLRNMGRQAFGFLPIYPGDPESGCVVEPGESIEVDDKPLSDQMKNVLEAPSRFGFKIFHVDSDPAPDTGTKKKKSGGAKEVE